MNYFRQNIEKLAAYQPGFQPPDGRPVIKLNTNENPYGPSPKVMEAVTSIDPEKIRRYPDPTAAAFRTAAANLHGVDPEGIICGNGADELLSMAMRAFCDVDRPVAYPVPTYSLYRVLAAIQGSPAVEVPFDVEYNLPSRLASAAASLTIVCNPNAPSGTVVRREELACLAAETAGVVLIDEAYVDFAGTDCMLLTRSLENVIVLRSMSKGYSLAGLRFGYAVASPPLVQGLAKIKDSYNVDAVAIAAATAAVGDQQWHRSNVEKIVSERASLTGALRELGFSVADSSANFVLARCTDVAASVLHEKLAARNIFVRYFDQDGLKDKLRITVGTQRQNAALLAALKDIIKEGTDG